MQNKCHDGGSIRDSILEKHANRSFEDSERKLTVKAGDIEEKNTQITDIFDPQTSSPEYTKS